jgi:hypothetical protein
MKNILYCFFRKGMRKDDPSEGLFLPLQPGAVVSAACTS